SRCVAIAWARADSTLRAHRRLTFPKKLRTLRDHGDSATPRPKTARAILGDRSRDRSPPVLVPRRRGGRLPLVAPPPRLGAARGSHVVLAPTVVVAGRGPRNAGRRRARPDRRRDPRAQPVEHPAVEIRGGAEHDSDRDGPRALAAERRPRPTQFVPVPGRRAREPPRR